jgi:hypothetical protein
LRELQGKFVRYFAHPRPYEIRLSRKTGAAYVSNAEDKKVFVGRVSRPDRTGQKTRATNSGRKAEQLPPVVEARAERDIVTLHMPLGGGRRTWLLGTPPRDESIAPLQAASRKVAPLPQHYVIKHGDFPLDEVKDYVLEWPGDHDNYPRLFVRKQDLAALRAKLSNNPAEVKRWTSQQPIDKYNIEAPLEAWFASDDERLGETIVKRSQEWLEMAVGDDLLDQGSRVTLGVAPHNQSVQLLPEGESGVGSTEGDSTEDSE